MLNECGLFLVSGGGRNIIFGGCGRMGVDGALFWVGGWVEVSGDEWGIILGGWGRVGKHFG